jgi:sugar phosphate permease
MVCVWPFINLLYRSNGLTDAQIGVLAALKPWTSAPSSFLWSGLADRLSAHKAIMLATFVTSTLTRVGVSLAHSFWAFLVLAAAGEFLAAPVGVMADAAVVAACKRVRATREGSGYDVQLNDFSLQT